MERFISQNSSLEKTFPTCRSVVDWGGARCMKKSRSCRLVTKNAASHPHTRQGHEGDKILLFQCSLKFLQSLLDEIFNLLIPAGLWVSGSETQINLLPLHFFLYFIRFSGIFRKHTLYEKLQYMFFCSNGYTLMGCQIKMCFSLLLVIFPDISRISYYAGEYLYLYT